MTRCAVEVLQPFEIEADHGECDGQSVEKQVEEEELGQNRKTRQRDHQCHCGKNFQVG